MFNFVAWNAIAYDTDVGGLTTNKSLFLEFKRRINYVVKESRDTLCLKNSEIRKQFAA